ncbi:MAG: lysylphosphatidylglycerol synthase transmembrane domain-containing protein [Anaerolineae bacterium]
MRRRTLQVLGTLAASGLALYLALRGVDFAQVREALRRIDRGWLLVSALLVVISLLIRAQRWRILLGRRLSLGDAFGVINIGYLISGVLPLRAGDPARAVGAQLRGPISALAALSTVVVVRVLDMLLIVVVLLVTLPFVPGLRTYLATGRENGIPLNLMLLVVGGLSLGMVALFVLLALYPQRVEALAARLLQMSGVRDRERWLKPLRRLLEGFQALSSPREGLAVMLWSLGLWAVTLSNFRAALEACRAFLPQGTWLAGAVSMWASAFGMVFPSTGGLGSFHFAVREALFWGFDISREAGFTYAVVVHATSYLTGILLGAAFLLLWGLSLERVLRRGAEINEP